MQLNKQASKGAFNQIKTLTTLLKRSDKHGFEVGVLQDKKHSSGFSIVGIAWVTHSGSGNIPARAWVYISNAMHKQRRNKAFKAEFKKFLRGKVTLNTVCNVLGNKWVGDDKTVLGDPLILMPNSPQWAARKGKNTPLVETGELRDSIDHKAI
ncbi:TPA: hypothetical protein RI707_003481 [Vibrio cholerae]|nr:hypothetical protein [Vibrio cholerae]HDV5298634.1 hypothetical protein [Vibrio cholerae]HDV5306144.1 hypothetical protein [Vibrio cholerae]HDV5309806.1 hypothetical protein [Vibrio cholerae]HDV5313468.1 hypothetical protein [Vibrio cholerae]